MAESLHEAKDYGFDTPNKPEFDWGTVKKKRDAYIQKLNGIYDNNLQKSHVEQLHGLASFVDGHTIHVSDPDNPSDKGYEVQGKHILIATGKQKVLWVVCHTRNSTKKNDDDDDDVKCR